MSEFYTNTNCQRYRIGWIYERKHNMHWLENSLQPPARVQNKHIEYFIKNLKTLVYSCLYF